MCRLCAHSCTCLCAHTHTHTDSLTVLYVACGIVNRINQLQAPYRLHPTMAVRTCTRVTAPALHARLG